VADRTSARIFGEIFELLAKRGERDLALDIATLSLPYDFSPYQMEAAEALETLGLATYDAAESTWVYSDAFDG
jgi:hypothetical protein